jgi:septum site-determining protein MinC
MKPKSLFPPKNNVRKNAPATPAADPNAGDPEDLREMWSAVAALLDDTTVGVAPSPATSVASAPSPSHSVQSETVIPPTVRSSNPDAPLSDSALGIPSSRTGTDALFAPVWSPKQNAEPVPPVNNAPSAETPSSDAPVPVDPAPPVRNGEPLTPPYNPGAGPQILPAPDDYLHTPPPSAPAPAPPLPRQPGEPFILPEGLEPQSVMIRGRNDGVGIEIGNGAWKDLLYVLSYRIEQTDGFFKGNHIAVDVGNRQLNEADLNQMRLVMRSFGMDPSLLRTASERTFQAALALGIPASQVGPDGTPINEAVPAQSDAEGLGFFVYRGSLRSGQVLYRREHIIVIGDVNPGAEVVSDGDVMVWGRLRGIAHAGARGNNSAVITALDLDPVQLRIDQIIGAAQAGISSNGPRWGANRSADRKAELARLVNGKLTIQPWDEVKTGGVALLKRRLF